MKRRYFSNLSAGHRSKNSERGVTIVLVALAMVAIMAVAALSIDVVTLYLADAEMQRSADTAALAAARVLSITGITGDPSNSTSNWQNACALASQVATAVARQNTVAGAQLAAGTQVKVTFPNNSDTTGCSGTTPVFGVNPLVTVQVQRTDLPTFFARIWGRRGASVSAKATAEAFNPSNSFTYTNGGGTGSVTPVQPRCVKPWLIPNADPGQPGHAPFLNLDGTIAAGAQGIRLSGGTTGIVGDTFLLNAYCNTAGSSCTQLGPPSAMTGGGITHYWPAQVSSSVAVPSCGTGSQYEEAVAGCDETDYQCGVKHANFTDLSENPKNGDTSNGLECLINQNGGAGSDNLDTTSYPFKMTAGADNLLAKAGSINNGTQITNSTSIVSLPIYDNTDPSLPTPPTMWPTSPVAVTVIGFLQVFVNNVNPGNQRISVTVLNVAGCGNDTAVPVGNAVTGSSPVPVRLVQSFP